MSSFLENSAALGATSLPVFGSDVGSTVFPTSVNGQEVNSLETRNVVNNSATGAGVLGTLTGLAGLFLNYKAAEATLKSQSTGQNIPAASTQPASAEFSPATKKALIYGAIALGILVALSFFRRR